MRPLSQWRRLAAYLRPYRRAVAGALAAILFTSVAVLGFGHGLRFLVDDGLGRQDTALLDRAFLLLAGVTLLLAAASSARFYLVAWLGERVVADIRNDAYRRLVHMDVSFFESARTGELISRLTTDTTLIQTVIATAVPFALRNLLLLVGGFTLLVLTSLKLTGFVSLMLPLVVLPIVLLGRRVRLLSREAQNRVAAISAHAEETISAIRTVKSLAIEPRECSRFGVHVQAALDAALGRIRTRALLTGIVIALVFGAVVTVLWVGAREVIAGSITGGDLSAFVFYSVITAGAVGALSEVMTELQRAAGAAERLADLLALAPTLPVRVPPRPLPDLRRTPIRFEQVSFHYPSRPERAAVAELDFELPPGESVALVGPSGGGKTTIFQLLLRFYDPDAGRVLLGDVDLRDADPFALRARIGFVPQDPVIFAASAWDNIRCGRADATDEEVRAAAAQAAALEFLELLPEGLGTFLGEKGVRLSGGQRQRIAIARALVRDPDLLLLDEATSALDAQSEQEVQRAIARLMEGRTTLVIAHRLATVRRAGRILLINQGRIEAAGTHDRLIAESELYARLASLQFREPADA